MRYAPLIVAGLALGLMFGCEERREPRPTTPPSGNVQESTPPTPAAPGSEAPPATVPPPPSTTQPGSNTPNHGSTPANP